MPEGKDEKRGAKDQSVELPQLAEGQTLAVIDTEAKGHETSPPPRFTEASLTKRLEDVTLYQTDPTAAQQASDRLAAIDDELMVLLERWEALEARAGNPV